MTRPKPTMLMILDGWGIGQEAEENAIYRSGTPVLNDLWARYPHTVLRCSGEDVGLPAGIMGNSEVGHLNIGAGRIVYQDLLRIDRAIDDGHFFENEALGNIMDTLGRSGKTLHLMGLVSDGGVHSQLTHLFALLDMARDRGLSRVCVHAILDGRDTAPDGGLGYVKALKARMGRNKRTVIASICGRYYAMDRDRRWNRTRAAYSLYTEGRGRDETDPVAAIQEAYHRGETDEFVKPIVLVDEGGAALGTINDGDGIIFFNFRADRARQITRAFTKPDFDEFHRVTRPDLAGFVCMTLYEEDFHLPIAFPPVHLDGILGQVISESGLRQLRIAETEKYAHVTYFFNGGQEAPFAGEDRCLIDSPRDVPTYDHKPEMSAEAVTDALLSRLSEDVYDFIVLNFANMDMVGHTGVMDAAIKACATVDRCAGRIVEAVTRAGGAVMITADHGNAEMMRDADGRTHTAHTTNPVRFILACDNRRRTSLREGRLGDIAPTVLDVMGIAAPPAMTGKSLVQGERKK